MDLVKYLTFFMILFLLVNLKFLVFFVYLDDMMGQLFVLFVLMMALVESAIGLALLVIIFRICKTIAVEFRENSTLLNCMKG
ncbi:hypothetical protein CY35_11G038500 [Sphagnum magellanicum]|nr:hypothetical protein CY35_11G038500 [Sphagnum magellanicum]